MEYLECGTAHGKLGSLFDGMPLRRWYGTILVSSVVSSFGSCKGLNSVDG